MGQSQSKRVSSTSTISLLTTTTTTINSPPNPTSPTSPTSPATPLSDITTTTTSTTATATGPRQLTRISEILDPRDIIREQNYLCTPTRSTHSSFHHDNHHHHQHHASDSPPNAASTTKRGSGGIVHSPSGNALGAEEFIAHPSRPLAMWERQERVLQATREGMERLEAESRAGTRSRMGKNGHGEREEGRGGKRGRGWCCGL